MQWAFKRLLQLVVESLPLVLILALISVTTPGRCQQSGQQAFDVSARRKVMFNHLRTIIEYRRACAVGMQKTGQPNDALFREQGEALSSQAFADAFNWARAEAHFIEETTSSDANFSASATTNEQERLLAFQRDLSKRIATLQTHVDDLNAQAGDADKETVKATKREKQHLLSTLAFFDAMKEAIRHVGETSQSSDGIGWVADINALQHSVPELQANVKRAYPVVSSDIGNGSGIVSQIERLAALIETRRSIRDLVHTTENTRKEAEQLRGPITAYALDLMQKSDGPSGAGGAELDSNTAKIRSLSAAAIPLSQEIIALETNRNNLASWQASVDGEYRQTFGAFLSRLFVMAGGLALIFVLGELWVHATRRYVRDQKRRRQFLVLRRVVAGTLSIVILILGFASNFNSLTTFAGFLTAGLAVGLQTILLSIAAYFFVIGKYGIKIGDRVTIASVTGEVIDVGPVRFYLLELAGSGGDLMPTGRVAVFSNAVLFQASTPLYKQLPGSTYSWRELSVTIANDANHDAIRKAIVGEIQKIVAEYQPELMRQHTFVQNWLQTTIGSPEVESRLLATNDVFLLWVRFPVQIKDASETDEKLTEALRDLIASQALVKAGVASIPLLKPSVRG